MNQEPLVYIVILNWNGWQDTITCLNSLQKIDYSNYQIIIVDNGSTNDSVQQIENWAVSNFQLKKAIESPDVKVFTKEKTDINFSLISLNEKLLLLPYGENLGFSGGCNLGITYSLREGADYILLLNNDACIAPNALTKLVSIAQKAEAAIAGARVLNISGTQVLFTGSRWPNHLFFNSISTSNNNDKDKEFWDTPYAEGSALLAHKSILEERLAECGHFLNPELFLYYEDTDFCIYGRSRGYRCVIVRDAIIYHGLAKSSGEIRSCYYTTRNRIYIANHLLDFYWKVFFHIYYVPSRVAILLFNMVRGRLKEKVAKAVINGLIDGYKGITGKWVNH